MYYLTSLELFGDQSIEIEEKSILEIEKALVNRNKKPVFVILTSDWGGLVKIDGVNYLFEIKFDG